jgi:hypothetical protein
MKMHEATQTGQSASGWLPGLRTYLGLVLVGNLLWESFHLPLYTIWQTGSLQEQALQYFTAR